MNNIIVITGPSGVGKTTLQNYLRRELEIEPLLCATTRQRREDDNLSEIQCVTENEFHNLVAENKFFFYSGDFYKYGYFYPANKKISNSFVTSYRDLPEILKKKKDDLDIFSIVLSFSDLEKNMRERLIQRRNTSTEEIDLRVNFALKDFEDNFAYAQETSDLLIYTDQLNIDEMCELSKNALSNSLENNKVLSLRRF